MRKYENAYSRDYLLVTDDRNLISLITYPDGSQRFFEYDTDGIVHKMVDTDFTVHSRVDSNLWTTDKGESWTGRINVVQKDAEEGLPGTVLITKTDGDFPVWEGLYFPHKIAIESDYLRDRTEVKRSVHFLNGRIKTYTRHDRHSLWMTNGELAEMLPDSPWSYALPWMCPVFMEAAAAIS